MRATSYGPRSITIDGSEAEILALQRMLAGVGFVGCGREGVPLFAEKFETITPQPDPHLMRHFTPAGPTVAKFTHERGLQTGAVKFDEGEETYCSLYVEHVCGYDYTPENYARAAARLSDLGLSCMRSPRGEDGRYWEHWFLPGLWAGKGQLEGCKSLEKAINVLIQACRPGSISAVRQRVALTVD
jgi:hypothetical protein